MKRNLSLLVLLVVSLAVFAQYKHGVIVENVFKTDTTSIGQKIIYPQFKNDEVTIAKVIIKPGMSTGWHKHTFPVFAYVLKGTLTVQIKHKRAVTFTAGQSFSEVINTWHNGTNKTNKDVVLIAFYMAGKGMPLSIHRKD